MRNILIYLSNYLKVNEYASLRALIRIIIKQKRASVSAETLSSGQKE
jgi:hypothetical protein